MKVNSKNSELPLDSFLFNVVKGTKGFTLIELLVVLVIVAMLATMALIGFGEFIDKAKTARAMEEVRAIEKDIAAYITDNGGQFPADLTVIGRGTLLDPWGNSYQYSTTPTRRFATAKNTDYDLYSKGADGASVANSMIDPLSLDDIVRFRDGAFTDVAGKYP